MAIASGGRPAAGSDSGDARVAGPVPVPVRSGYGVCERCGQPVGLDHVTGVLRTVAGRDAGCYGGRHIR